MIVTTFDGPLLSIPLAIDSITALLRRPAAVLPVLAKLLLTMARRSSRAALVRVPLAIHLATTLGRRGIHHVHATGDLSSTIAWIMACTGDVRFSFALEPHAALLGPKLENAAFVRDTSERGTETPGVTAQLLPHGSESAGRLMVLFAQPEDERRTEASPTIGIAWETLGASKVGIRWSSWRHDAGVAEVSLYGGRERRDVIVKRHSRRPPFTESAANRARNEFETLQLLARSMPETASVPHVLLFDEETLTIVMEKAAGEPLDRLFATSNRSRSTLLIAVARAAEWLKIMQSVTRREIDASRYVTDAAALAHRDLRRVAHEDAAVRRRVRLIERRITGLTASVAERATTVAGHHGDFWPGNVFIAPHIVTAIDFEGYREGLPAEDVAYFLIRTELLSRRFGLRAAPLQTAFIDAWGGIRADELELFTITKALRTYVNTVEGSQSVLQRLWTMRVLRSVLLQTHRQ